MKSIQVIASLLCGILYCGISLNAQNVLKATGSNSIDNQMYNDVLIFLYLLHFFYSSSLSSVVSRFFCSFVSRIET